MIFPEIPGNPRFGLASGFLSKLAAESPLQMPPILSVSLTQKDLQRPAEVFSYQDCLVNNQCTNIIDNQHEQTFKFQELKASHVN